MESSREVVPLFGLPLRPKTKELSKRDFRPPPSKTFSTMSRKPRPRKSQPPRESRKIGTLPRKSRRKKLETVARNRKEENHPAHQFEAEGVPPDRRRDGRERGAEGETRSVLRCEGGETREVRKAAGRESRVEDETREVHAEGLETTARGEILSVLAVGLGTTVGGETREGHAGGREKTAEGEVLSVHAGDRKRKVQRREGRGRVVEEEIRLVLQFGGLEKETLLVHRFGNLAEETR